VTLVYRCDKCGKEFEGGPEAKAEAEFQSMFGDDPKTTPSERANPDERDVLCDHCWKMFLKWLAKNHPEVLQKGLLT
jgi:hypothetical protein